MKDLVKIYIVEDAAIARASLEDMLFEHDFEVVGSSAKAENVWNDLQTMEVDLILLDVNLAGDKNGIWLAEQVRGRFHIPIIYLTAYGDQKTLNEVVATKPNGYLMKPYQEATLITTINIVLENFNKNKIKQNKINDVGNDLNVIQEKKKYSKYLFVKKNKKVVKIDVPSIYYVSVEEKYCSLNSANSSYLIRMSLKEVMKLLPETKFKQVHRSYLVNLDKIKEMYFEDSLIVLDNNEKVPFSERYKSIFRKDNDIFY
ncbi:LytTR family two component transcriptional regulator [Tenacibaculum adriaticum]|uniref:LytTR family two component transcriptional regulator n=1 Tax=Tenacibaculum adriaticum TaxID=413713 RepID=A0A5S5DUE9_9FLAO|nr:response regulator transcription factor [Tenacibaculum adriaticum]TYP99517.1 LytTR family two component transcriptional regulator [Tenacibaculum adriaticum]